jgi:hypothetical protein
MRNGEIPQPERAPIDNLCPPCDKLLRDSLFWLRSITGINAAECSRMPGARDFPSQI